MNIEPDTIISLFLGIGLAASAGFRVFLPLFALSFAAYLGVWELNDNWQWIGSLTALITLGIATVVEIFAYFIPWVDNALDTIALPLAGIAGTAAVVSTASNMDPVITWSLAIIAGGGTATAIKGANATGRSGVSHLCLCQECNLDGADGELAIYSSFVISPSCKGSEATDFGEAAVCQDASL